MADIKSSFTLDIQNIYLQLHKSAKQKAINVAGGKNLYLCNTACVDDKNFEYETKDRFHDAKMILITFLMKVPTAVELNNIYNMLSENKKIPDIITELQKKHDEDKNKKDKERSLTSSTDSDDDDFKEKLKTIETNLKEVKSFYDNIESIAIKSIKEYFLWFGGDEASKKVDDKTIVVNVVDKDTKKEDLNGETLNKYREEQIRNVAQGGFNYGYKKIDNSVKEPKEKEEFMDVQVVFSQEYQWDDDNKTHV